MQWMSRIGAAYMGRIPDDRLDVIFTPGTIIIKTIYIILGILFITKSKDIASWLKIDKKEAVQ